MGECAAPTSAVGLEVAVYIVAVAHLLIQNYNVYRLNFHNWDWRLVIFSSCVLLDRVCASYIRLRKAGVKKRLPLLQETYYITVCVGAVAVGGTLLVDLVCRRSLKDVVFLFYPAVLHLTFVYGQDGGLFGTLRRLWWSVFEIVFYAGLLPVKLCDPHLYYDRYNCASLAFSVLGNSLALLTYQSISQGLPAKVKALGKWQRIPSLPTKKEGGGTAARMPGPPAGGKRRRGEEVPVEKPPPMNGREQTISPWIASQSYALNEVVEHQAHYFVCVEAPCGPQCPEPGAWWARALDAFAGNPRVAQRNTVLVLLAFGCVQFVLLVVAEVGWHAHAAGLLLTLGNASRLVRTLARESPNITPATAL